MLTVDGVDVFYGRVRAVASASLTVARGELVTIVGPNGSGKTTLLRAITGLVPVAAGAVRLDGTTISAMRTEDIVRLGLALVAEGRDLFGPLTVRENLVLGAYPLPRHGGRRQQKDDLARVLGLFPALESRLAQPAATLSGGEQQMLAIGRALMARPRLLLLDEPSVGLAPLVVREIFRTLAMLRAEGLTMLLVEQNARAAFRIADRGYALEPGGRTTAVRPDMLAGGTENAYGLESVREETLP